MTFWWILLSLPHSRHPSLQTRHRGEHGWSQRLDVVGDGQRGALVEADAAALLQDRNLHQSLQHVRQWEVGEVARVFVGGDASVETAAERGDEVLVRDERALRHAGGARGVADRAHVRGLRRDVGDAVRATELLDLAHAVESDVLGGRGERGATAVFASSRSLSVISSIWMITFRGTFFSAIDNTFTVSAALQTIAFISVSRRMYRTASAPRVSYVGTSAKL